jgi:hypothetical protein
VLAAPPKPAQSILSERLDQAILEVIDNPEKTQPTSTIITEN